MGRLRKTRWKGVKEGMKRFGLSRDDAQCTGTEQIGEKKLKGEDQPDSPRLPGE